jgi:4-hydroxy-3-methylbut-2-enyl diphosphate reductase
MINPVKINRRGKHMALEILVARDSSFCPGVDRAMRKTEKRLSKKRGPVYSFGPLIHNPQVVSRLRRSGLETLEPGSDFPDLRGVPVVIRSHGIDIESERALAECGAKLVDATCNTVKRAQRAAQEVAEAGYRVVVLGSPRHPEVRSIIGRAGADVTVISNMEEAERFAEEAAAKPGPVGIVCQTTISHTLLDSVVSLLRSRGIVVEVRDTICKWVARRQQEAVELSKRVDMMLVVGGRNSSNTAQLAAICSASGVSTHHIEDPSEIRPEWLEGIASVGITGGASTPDWLIDETVVRLKEMASG